MNQLMKILLYVPKHLVFSIHSLHYILKNKRRDFQYKNKSSSETQTS